MYQIVQTCFLEVISTRIGIKLPIDIVYRVRSSLPHATRYTWNMYRSNKEHTNTRKHTRIYTWRIYQLWQWQSCLITPWFVILSLNLITFTILDTPDTTWKVHNLLLGCLQDRCSNDVDTSCASETEIGQAHGILWFFIPWSTNMLVSVGQTVRQRIN